ncbi:MAG: MFS transporter [Alphaproteobacteria bacterium]|nr:MAG: MFS transporter [Alphaproteobacteria bacterium]
MPFAAKTPPHLATLVFFTALTTLTLNMFLPSLPHMAENFGVEYSLMTLAIAGYLAATAILMLVLGPLSDFFGRRPVMLVTLCLFTLASITCALAGNFGLFLTARIGQGIIIGGWGLSLAIVRDRHESREAASRIGFMAMAMAIAPMLAPVAGGGLDALLGWRAVFWLYALLGAIALLLCWIDLGETKTQRADGFGAQLRSYPELLKSLPYWGYALAMAFSTGGFYIFIAGAPLIAGHFLDLTPAELGVGLGVSTAGYITGSFLSGRFNARFPLFVFILLGRIVSAAGVLAGLIAVLTGYLDPYILFGTALMVGVGNGLTIPGANAGALSVNPELSGSALGLAGALTVGGGAVLTSLTGAVVTEETGAPALFALMLGASVISLGGSLIVWRTDRSGPGI